MIISVEEETAHHKQQQKLPPTIADELIIASELMPHATQY